jgi:hypothetical protein
MVKNNSKIGRVNFDPVLIFDFRYFTGRLPRHKVHVISYAYPVPQYTAGPVGCVKIEMCVKIPAILKEYEGSASITSDLLIPPSFCKSSSTTPP